MSSPSPPSTRDRGATVVITHRVREGEQAAYERWLVEIREICSAYPGHLDWQLVRPIAGLTGTYTFVIRFDSEPHLRAWMSSDDRKRLVAKVRPLLATDDDFAIKSGLDFWFTPEGARATVPVRWKQVLLTWSAIFPLVVGVPIAVLPALRALRIAGNGYINTLLVSGVICVLMSYVVMPHYTRLVKRWLFR